MADGNAVPGSGTPGSRSQRISREMVTLMRNTAGRGPTTARTTIGRDHVLVMLQDTLTDGERVLVENGYRDEVMKVREAVQAVIKDDAVRLVEGVLDRKVLGFMSTNHFDPDYAAEVFVLDPAGESSGRVPEEADSS